MKKIIKKFFTPFAVFAMALGIGVSLSAPKEVKGVKAAETAVISYSGDTTNMTGGNDAALLGLDDELFSVVSDKNGGGNHVGLGSDGTLRLYYRSGGEGVILSVSLNDNSYHITGFTINYAERVAKAKIVVDGIEKINEEITANGFHSLSNLSATAFSIQNVNTTNTQLRINTISIDYELKSSPSVNITNGPGNLEVGEEFQFLAITANVEGTPTISWSVEDEEVASINPSGLLTTIAPGSTNVVASITVEDITYTHKVLINVLHDEPEAIQVTIGEILEVENSKATLYKGVARIKGWGTDGTKSSKDIYGNMRLIDIDGSAEIAVYGSSFEEGTISFNRVTGLFESLTRYSFLEDSRSIALQVGDIIEFDAIRNDYQGTPQLNVQIKSVVDEDYTAARDFADDVVNGEGLNAQGNCEVVYASLMTKYNALSEGAKEVFEENAEAIFVSARARLNYLEAFVGSLNKAPESSRTASDAVNKVALTLIVGVLGLSSLIGFAFISKKKF